MTLSEDTAYQIVATHHRNDQREVESRHQWDINDNTLPIPSELDEYQDWSDGHCRLAYADSEDARRHSSGWAMRNTNNHNVNILKKSCLGVLRCDHGCVSEKGERIHLRPAICDKARKKQIGRPCSNPLCLGKLELQPCHGHCGYPVTHFWRHTNGIIYFQAKGVHDHPQPEIKASAEARRHAQSSKENKLKLSDMRRAPRKRMLLDADTLYSRLYKVPKLEKTGNDVICSCPPFECLCQRYHSTMPQNGSLIPPIPNMLPNQKQFFDREFSPMVKEEPRIPVFDFKQEPGFEPPVSIMDANQCMGDFKPTTCQNDCMYLDSLPISVTTSATSAMQCQISRVLNSSPRDFVDGGIIPTSLCDNTVPSMTGDFSSPKMSLASQIEQNMPKLDTQKVFGNLLSQADASVLDLNLPSITAFFRDENFDKPLDDSFTVHKAEDALSTSYDCAIDQRSPVMSPISEHRATPPSHPASPVSLIELKPMNNAQNKFSNFQTFPSPIHTEPMPAHHNAVNHGMGFEKRAFQPYVPVDGFSPYPLTVPNFYSEMKQDFVRPQPNMNTRPMCGYRQDIYPPPPQNTPQGLSSLSANANINITFINH